MTAILLNDTRSEEHIGCDLVMAHTFAEAARVKLAIIETVTNAEALAAEDRVHASEADLVLINGEGTMHSDRPKPLALARAARAGKEMGKRVVLYNSVWQRNNLLNDYLRHFDLIFCRETLSTEQVKQAGFDCETVPDMVLARPLARATGSARPAVTDSVFGETSKRLAWLAVRRRATFVPFSRSSFSWFASRLRMRLPLRLFCSFRKTYSPTTALNELASAPEIITGRYHGVCLALNLGKPVVSVTSNTHKVEGLFRDIGIEGPTDEKSALDSQALDSRLRDARENLARCEAYVVHGRMRIRQMFDAIAAPD